MAIEKLIAGPLGNRQEVHMYCPNCGHTSIYRQGEANTCTECATTLILHSQYRAEYLLSNSGFPTGINYELLAERNSAAELLTTFDLAIQNVGAIHFSSFLMDAYQNPDAEDLILAAYDRDYNLRMGFLELVYSPEFQGLWQYYENKDPRFETDVDRYAFVPIAHANGTFTLLALKKKQWLERGLGIEPELKNHYAVVISRFIKPPQNDDELKVLLGGYVTDRSKYANRLAGYEFNASIRIGQNLETIKNGRLEIIRRINEASETTQALIHYMDTQLELAQSKNISGIVSDQLPENPKSILQGKATQIETLYAEKIENGISLGCFNCHKQLEVGMFTQPVVKCTSCNYLNDVVDQGLISPDMLQARELYQTRTNLEYIALLVFKVLGEDIEKYTRFVSLFNQAELSSKDRSFLADVILEVSKSAPHLFVSVKGTNIEGHVVGLIIKIPDQVECKPSEMTGSTIPSFSINPYYKGQNIFVGFNRTRPIPFKGESHPFIRKYTGIYSDSLLQDGGALAISTALTQCGVYGSEIDSNNFTFARDKFDTIEQLIRRISPFNKFPK